MPSERNHSQQKMKNYNKQTIKYIELDNKSSQGKSSFSGSNYKLTQSSMSVRSKSTAATVN